MALQLSIFYSQIGQEDGFGRIQQKVNDLAAGRVTLEHLQNVLANKYRSAPNFGEGPKLTQIKVCAVGAVCVCVVMWCCVL